MKKKKLTRKKNESQFWKSAQYVRKAGFENHLSNKI